MGAHEQHAAECTARGRERCGGGVPHNVGKLQGAGGGVWAEGCGPRGGRGGRAQQTMSASMKVTAWPAMCTRSPVGLKTHVSSPPRAETWWEVMRMRLSRLAQ